MLERPCNVKAPVAWLPAGLISWYGTGGLPIALATSWVALIGGERPRIRTAWHGRQDALSRFWSGGDFVLNVPGEDVLDRIRHVISKGALSLPADTGWGFSCISGVAAVAPRLLECAVQIECVAGKLVDTGFDAELCGAVARVHRGEVVIDPLDIPDLCAILPLSPLASL